MVNLYIVNALGQNKVWPLRSWCQFFKSIENHGPKNLPSGSNLGPKSFPLSCKISIQQIAKYVFHSRAILGIFKALCSRGRAQTIIFKKNCHFYSKKGLVGSVNIGLVRLESHDLSPSKKRFTRSIGFLRYNVIATKAKWTKEIHVGKVSHPIMACENFTVLQGSQ